MGKCAASAPAARKTLERRLSHSGGHTGWSRAWLVNFFSRLNDGESTLENLNAIFSEFTLPNLLNNGPPFQIDGNFGALAGIAQMLIQSRVCYSNTNTSIVLDILPALPQNWPMGRLKGARVKGNMELDLEWRNCQLVSLIIRSDRKAAVSVLLRVGNESRELTVKPGETAVM